MGKYLPLSTMDVAHEEKDLGIFNLKPSLRCQRAADKY